MPFTKFFVHRVNQKKSVLITDAGNWVTVSNKELKAIEAQSVSPSLKRKLEEKKILVSSKNKASLIKDYRALYSHVSQGISLHIINPTMRCNQFCHYCYADSMPMKCKGFDMSIETAKKTIDFIWQSARKNMVIEFQGGEPLANFSTIQFIIDYAAKKRPKKRVHWRLVSNFSLLDETIARYLSKHVSDLCTSLDGPKKVHDKNRPMHGSSYKKVIHWLHALRNDFGFKRIGALCTVTKHSLPLAEQVVQEYVSHGLPDITPVPVRRIGRAKRRWRIIGCSAEQYVSFWRRVLDKCVESTKDNALIAEQFASIITQKLCSPKPAYHACFSRPCGAALMQCSYQPDGSIYTCDEGKAIELFKLGTVEQPYKEVFTSPNALNMVAVSSALGLLCNECKWYAYCSFCPVMAYSTQQSLIPLLYNSPECFVRKAQFTTVFEKMLSKDKRILMRWVRAALCRNEL